MGDRELVSEARKRAYRLDPRSFLERRRKVEADRHTRLRAAPDTTALFTALLRVKDGIAMHAILGREADRLRNARDRRRRGQLAGDVLVQRVVDPAAEDTSGAGGLPLMVNLVVSEKVLLGTTAAGMSKAMARVHGDVIRDWVADAAEDDVAVWVRRIYQPHTIETVTRPDMCTARRPRTSAP